MCLRCGPRAVRGAAAFPHYLVRSGAPRTKLKHAGPPQGKTEELVLLQRNDLRSRGSSCRQNRPPSLGRLSQEQQEAQDLILPYQGLGKGDKWRIYGQTEMSQAWAAQDSRPLSTGKSGYATKEFVFVFNFNANSRMGSGVYP